MNSAVSVISAGVMTACLGAFSVPGLVLCAPASGMFMTTSNSATSNADRARCDQRTGAAGHGDERGDDRRRHRAAEIAGKGVDREGAAHPRLVHMLGEDGVIGGMVDAVGEPEQHGAGDQRGVAQMQAEQDQREAAEREPAQQDLARAKMVDEIAGRRLRQRRDHGRHGQREAELDIADAELALQERKQHRQDQQMEMADPMRDRNSRQRA